VREVSWSNVRDKLNIGLFDAAHLLAPVAIASSLGLGPVKVPIITPSTWPNGNAITVSCLHAALKDAAEATSPIRWCRRRRWPAWWRTARRVAASR
jgi:NitT/TauT family transport system ATP-binding protein